MSKRILTKEIKNEIDGLSDGKLRDVLDAIRDLKGRWKCGNSCGNVPKALLKYIAEDGGDAEFGLDYFISPTYTKYTSSKYLPVGTNKEHVQTSITEIWSLTTGQYLVRHEFISVMDSKPESFKQSLSHLQEHFEPNKDWTLSLYPEDRPN